MKNDLSNLTEGQKLFCIQRGEVIFELNKDLNFAIKASGESYSKEGKLYSDSKHPSLFKSAKHAGKYFASIGTKKTRDIWINVYGYYVEVFNHEVDATYNHRDNCLTTIKKTLEWEE